jgi:hypothetical protein
MSPKTDLHNFQDISFDLILYISYFLLFISYIGISASAPKYLDIIDYYIRIYTCLFLIWRFNPLRSKYEFTDLDRKIAFSAGLIVLTTTALNTHLVKFKDVVKNRLQ